ncbi:hypothetical protein FUAX_55580 (plasmid) [Fulvitalea axinellae]|uniref:Uncharacterized protein n=1 Tax=Fulvitalea axinellae TaxID=1182444 RepID=A0AAU9CVN4_9BACT|nr:hypothetical protein FUAX_55580 [Fulvitalea axinellae]
MAPLSTLKQLLAEYTFTNEYDSLDSLRTVLKNPSDNIRSFYNKTINSEWKDLFLFEEEMPDGDYERLISWSSDESISIEKVRITLNKKKIRDITLNENTYCFFSENAFNQWLETLDPFQTTIPFNQEGYARFLVKGLTNEFFGNNFAVQKLDSPDSDHKPPHYTDHLPEPEKIEEQVKSFVKTDFLINPKAFVIKEGEPSKPIRKRFEKHANILLASSLASELYDTNPVREIALNVEIRHEIQLWNGQGLNVFNSELLTTLSRIITWIYEERTSARLRIFRKEILSHAQSQPNEDLINILSKAGKQAFSQSIEIYGFLIDERREQYEQENRIIQTDIQKQTDQYNARIRNTATNFARDFLASLFIITVGISEKWIGKDSKKLLPYLMNGIAIYFLLSLIIQSWSTILELSFTKRDFTRWINRQGYLLDSTKKRYLDETKNKQRYTITYLIVVAILYALIIIFSFCYKYWIPVYVST